MNQESVNYKNCTGLRVLKVVNKRETLFGIVHDYLKLYKKVHKYDDEYHKFKLPSSSLEREILSSCT